MALEFALPDVGEGLVEAVVLQWLAAEGEEVGLDQPMVELETDKAVVEMPAPRAGVILHHGAPAGEAIEVGALLVVIGDPGEAWEPVAEPSGADEEAAGSDAPVVGTLEEAGAAGVVALPAVRKLASQLGVDLESLAGTGPGGRITRADVEAAAAPVPGDYERVRLSATRRAIARNMARSWAEIPHVTTFGEADAARILRERADLAASSRDAVPLEALLIRAIVPVLKEYPMFNATLQGEHVLLHRRYDIGFAIDTKEGLVIAVVRRADALGTYELARKIVDLATAARDRSIPPEDMRDATFTLSNIGAVGGRYGTPLVPPGTTAVLSVGRADPTPVVKGDKVVVGRRFPLSLSYDHRVVDGALGRRFLADVAEAFERYSD